MAVLNAAREAVENGLSNVALAAATATLSSVEKSDVCMLCDFVSADALSLCHELSQLSADTKHALVDGATEMRGRPSVNIDTPRGLVGLMLKVPHNGSLHKKSKSQQSIYEQASDHPCASC
jgi:hypothetical protein